LTEVVFSVVYDVSPFRLVCVWENLNCCCCIASPMR